MTEYTAGIFIINNKNEILLTHATNSAIKYWGIPKGLADSGETHLDAAIREVDEETGIKFLNPKKIKFLGNMKYKNNPKTLAAFYVFLEDLDPNDLYIASVRVGGIVGDTEGKDIDPSLLYCRSMVEPKKEGDKPFPEVDAFRWFPLDVASEILYQPQKAILPELIKVIQKRTDE